MVEHQSKEVVDKVSEELKIQPQGLVPKEVNKGIQLVYEVNPQNRVQRVVPGFTTGSGGATIMTTSATKDTFLTSLTFGMIKDVVNSVATGRLGLTIIIGGETIRIMQIPVITLTAQATQVIIKQFNPAIKLDRGSAISFSVDSFGAGVMMRTAEVVIFETDPQ